MLVRGIDHMLVDFIGDNKAIVFHSQFTDLHQFFSCKYFSARVGRVADDDCFGSGFESFFHKLDIKLISRRNQWNVDGFRS